MKGREEGQAEAFNYMWNVYLLSRKYKHRYSLYDSL